MSNIPKISNADRSGNKKRRRRKKRRTEDFSDSSDSSSSSSSSSSPNSEDELNEPEIEETIHQNNDITALSDTEVNFEEPGHETIDFNITKKKLQNVKLTTTSLNRDFKNINTAQVEQQLDASHKELENKYLGLMFENYGNDIDQIRSAPDFNEKSLTLLANVLKSGSNIFDKDTLKAVVGEKQTE